GAVQERWPRGCSLSDVSYLPPGGGFGSLTIPQAQSPTIKNLSPANPDFALTGPACRGFVAERCSDLAFISVHPRQCSFCCFSVPSAVDFLICIYSRPALVLISRSPVPA